MIRWPLSLQHVAKESTLITMEDLLVFVIFDMSSPESIQMQAVPICSEVHIHKNKSADLASACVDTQIVVILLHVIQVKHLKLMTPQ